ncbi:amidohydrolase family protein [Streptomyces virginiae]|uniref:amidohydrolase family protein n=1 Tax=Streptomyces virginiae TaxID=1961 RepID=UPI0035DE5E65
MRTRIHGVRVFDGERGAGVQDVVVEDDLVVAVSAPGAAQDADVQVDGRGMTLLPGLIDAHTHVFDDSLAEALRHGVTTELDMFCLPRPLARHRRLAADRDDVADLRSAGLLATAPGGHPTQLIAALTGTLLDPEDVSEIDFVTDPERAADFVKARLAEGSDFLKLVIDDGTVHGAALPVMSPTVAAALTAAAHAAGLPVVAHAVTAADVVTALDAGVDGLAHVWADLAPRDPVCARLARRVRDRGVFVVSTLAYFEAVDAQGAGAATCVPAGRYPAAVGALRALREAGVPLLAGTDATPFAPAHGSGLHRELALLVQDGGLSPREALAAATALPARHFGLADRGRIAPGLRADLLLVEGDPTREVSALGAIVDVWRRGVRQPR